MPYFIGLVEQERCAHSKKSFNKSTPTEVNESEAGMLRKFPQVYKELDEEEAKKLAKKPKPRQASKPAQQTGAEG